MTAAYVPEEEICLEKRKFVDALIGHLQRRRKAQKNDLKITNYVLVDTSLYASLYDCMKVMIAENNDKPESGKNVQHLIDNVSAGFLEIELDRDRNDKRRDHFRYDSAEGTNRIFCLCLSDERAAIAGAAERVMQLYLDNHCHSYPIGPQYPQMTKASIGGKTPWNTPIEINAAVPK